MSNHTESPGKRPRLNPAVAVIGGAVLVLAGGFGIARASGFASSLHHGRHAAMAHDVIELRLGKALDSVGATDDQKQRIKAILDAGFARHQALAGEHDVLHQQLLAALSGPTVDRAAVEAVRAEALSKLDQASKDLAKSIGDAADVLTPAQRTQLAQLHLKAAS